MINLILNLAAFSLLLPSTPLILSQAQTFKPNYAINPATTFVEGKTLYVVGGLDPSNNTNPLNQVFTLDLSSRWKTSNPPFTSLPSITTDYYTAAGIFDTDTLILTTKESIKTYNLSNSNLSTIGNVSWVQQPGGVIGVNSVKDTIFATYVKAQGGTEDKIIPYVSYGLINKSVEFASTSISPKIFSIWFESMKAIFVNRIDSLISISSYNKNGVDILDFSTSKTTLSNLKGPFCSVGIKKYMVVFGDDESSVSTIATLDNDATIWKVGQNPDFLMEPAACAVTGDYFVVWGRLSNGESSVKVYNLNGGFWTDEFGALDPAPELSPSQIGGIIGGTCAVVVGILAIFIYRCWKGNKKRTAPEDCEMTSNGKIEIVE